MLPSALGAVAASAVLVVIGGVKVVSLARALVAMSVVLVLKHTPSVGSRQAPLANSWCMHATMSPRLEAVSHSGVHSLCVSM